MPFKSKAQRAFLFAKHPDIAKRWAALTPDEQHLPEHAEKPTSLAEYLKKPDEEEKKK